MQPNKLCEFYGSAIGCKFGDNCRYSHTNPNSISFCKYYHSINGCKWGNQCYFRHNHFAIIQENMFPSIPICTDINNEPSNNNNHFTIMDDTLFPLIPFSSDNSFMITADDDNMLPPVPISSVALQKVTCYNMHCRKTMNISNNPETDIYTINNTNKIEKFGCDLLRDRGYNLDVGYYYLSDDYEENEIAFCNNCTKSLYPCFICHKLDFGPHALTDPDGCNNCKKQQIEFICSRDHFNINVSKIQQDGKKDLKGIFVCKCCFKIKSERDKRGWYLTVDGENNKYYKKGNYLTLCKQCSNQKHLLLTYGYARIHSNEKIQSSDLILVIALYYSFEVLILDENFKF